jgi:hypothetical protein
LSVAGIYGAYVEVLEGVQRDVASALPSPSAPLIRYALLDGPLGLACFSIPFGVRPGGGMVEQHAVAVLVKPRLSEGEAALDAARLASLVAALEEERLREGGRIRSKALVVASPSGWARGRGPLAPGAFSLVFVSPSPSSHARRLLKLMDSLAHARLRALAASLGLGSAPEPFLLSLKGSEGFEATVRLAVAFHRAVERRLHA